MCSLSGLSGGLQASILHVIVVWVEERGVAIEYILGETAQNKPTARYEMCDQDSRPVELLESVESDARSAEERGQVSW